MREASAGTPSDSTVDWSRHLRPRLASLRLGAAREAEIIEELSQHLDDRYEQLRAEGCVDAEAQRLALEELDSEDALAGRMRALRQAHLPPPLPEASEGRGLLTLDSSTICAMPRGCCASSRDLRSPPC